MDTYVSLNLVICEAVNSGTYPLKFVHWSTSNLLKGLNSDSDRRVRTAFEADRQNL